MITRQKIDSYYNPIYGDISVFLFFFLLRDRNCCINIVSRDISRQIDTEGLLLDIVSFVAARLKKNLSYD